MLSFTGEQLSINTTNEYLPLIARRSRKQNGIFADESRALILPQKEMCVTDASQDSLSNFGPRKLLDRDAFNDMNEEMGYEYLDFDQNNMAHWSTQSVSTVTVMTFCLWNTPLLYDFISAFSSCLPKRCCHLTFRCRHKMIWTCWCAHLQTQ